MLIRIILLAALALIGYFAFLRRNAFPFHVIVVFAVLAGAGGLVVFPGVAVELATLAGVGRGVDLVTYLVEVALLFVVVHYFTKFVDLQRQLTVLARELALLKAEVEESNREDCGAVQRSGAETDLVSIDESRGNLKGE